MSDQIKIPCLFMRGGTSRGPYFLKSDLPSDIEQRDKILLAAMGSPDIRQIDGLGGADPVKSKVAIISKSEEKNVDVDYHFAQVKIDEPIVDTKPSCGNMLSSLIALDKNSETNLKAQSFFKKANQDKKIKTIVNPALETLEKLKHDNLIFDYKSHCHDEKNVASIKFIFFGRNVAT